MAFALEYPDEPTLLRRMLSLGLVAELAEAIGEEVVDGGDPPPLPAAAPTDGYRVATEWRTLIARAGAGAMPEPGT